MKEVIYFQIALHVYIYTWTSIIRTCTCSTSSSGSGSVPRCMQEFLKSSKYPVVIISYEMFLRTYDSLKSVRFDVIVCDEGHRLKNNSTKTTSVLYTYMINKAKRLVIFDEKSTELLWVGFESVTHCTF